MIKFKKQPIAGLCWCYLICINDKPKFYIWGKLPFSHLKGMVRFRPLIVFSRYGR